MLGTIKGELKNLRSPLYRNSIYISLSSLTTALAGFIFWVIAARLYPEGDVGVASAVVSALNLTFQLSMLGMSSSLIRFYPEYREKAMETALFVTTIASLVFSVGYGLLMMTSDSFSGLSSAAFLGTFVLFSVVGTAYNVFSTYAIARRKAEHSFFQNLLFSARFIFLFLFTALGALGIILSIGLGILLGLIYALIFIGEVLPRLDRKFLKDAFKFSFGNYIAGIANSAPNYLMPTIVLAMLGEKEAAYLYMALTVGNLILFVPNAINTSFFVEGSHGLKDMRRTLKKAAVFSYLYLALAVVFVWLFGGLVLRFFGEGYAGGLGLLRLVVIGGFFVVPVNFSMTVLNIQKRVKEVVAINVTKAVLFLGLSYLLIPRVGIEGVGWGWVGGYFGTYLILRILQKWPSSD
ncbi:lipopolysaccharide biosynthesis protein [Thermococcus zilligii]|uniref:lipopolysaccharide biosynthesis protein n=1 Tax=Thermococcus zilligii TaxID=54076 RepID=UPI00029A2D16|nr:oligosaccharide flippase family protein [Thermococcus zilligii]